MRWTAPCLLALALIVGCTKEPTDTDAGPDLGTDVDLDGADLAVDCDDGNPAIHPGAAESCNQVDDDCDGAIDEDAGDRVFYADVDGDGRGTTTDAIVACVAPAGFVADGTDCDDANGDVYPGAPEACDGADQNCNGIVDEDAEDAFEWHPDADQDGFGSAALVERSCEALAGYVEDASDCHDFAPDVHPGAVEVCDGFDNDCNGNTDGDDALDPATWYADADDDGYGDPSSTTLGCDVPDGFVGLIGDCDDVDASISPDASEICDDGVDNDCSGDAPECGLQGVVSVADADVAFSGAATYDYLGTDVAIVGDVDGDGYDDLLLDAYGNDDAASSAGAAYLVYSSGSGPTGGSVSAADATFTGGASSDYFGWALSSAGDHDGDGYDDFVVGAYGYDAGSTYSVGAAYLFYGSATRYAGSAAAIDAASAVLVGEASYDYAGYGVRHAGDVDGDGTTDLLIGAYGGSSDNGYVYLVYGAAGGLSGTQSLSAFPRFTGAESYDYAGYHYGMGGADLDGDGFSDLAVGAYSADVSGDYTVGTVHVNYGDATQAAGAMSLGAADATINGATNDGDSAFGYSVAGAGDMNGDGYEDLAVGAYYYDTDDDYDAGGVFVFFGEATRWAGTNATVDLVDAVLTGANSSDYVGRNVAGGGDANGDGLGDLLVGASGWDLPASSAGATFVVYGDLAMGGTAEITTADVHIQGGGSSAYVGYGMSIGGDVDGDGYDDILLGANGAATSAGAAYLFFGSGI